MKFESEADLAATVQRLVSGTGWDAYAEVQVGQGEQRADIVLQSGRRIMIVETKLSLSVDVISQAYRWLDKAHYVVIAVPAPKNHSSERIAFIVDCLRQQGIGLWWITPGELINRGEDRVLDTSRLTVLVKERLHRWADSNAQKLRQILVDEMRTATAGAKIGGVASTPFKRTCLTLYKYVEKHPGITFLSGMENIQHHYSSLASARSSIELIVKTAGLEIRDGLLYVPGAQDADKSRIPIADSGPRPEITRRYSDTAVVRCKVCRGMLGQVKYDAFGTDFIHSIKPKLERQEAYLEWEKSTDLPRYQPCGCNGRQHRLL